MTTPRPRLVALTGPTASGKTALAVELALRFNAEIINADSVQVYRGADIGSAKPRLEELEGVPHHLLSALDPEEEFDAARFRREARALVLDANKRGVLPLVCGGTGLYLRALLGGLVETPEITDEAKHILAELESRGENLHEALKQRDPYTAESLAAADRARCRRALLVNLSSGASLRRLKEAHGHREDDLSALVVCLLPPREELYRAIETRVDAMLDAGLVEETKLLRERHPHDAKIFSALGYRHAADFLDRKISRAEMIEDLKRDTRRFAKRQYTWWRHQPEFLGWQRIAVEDVEDEDEDGEIDNVKTGIETNITELLGRAIKSFMERHARYSAEGTYFLAVAKN